MPEKYHIETRPVPPRRPRIGKYGVIDWREDCARCRNCVKKACIYDRHHQEMDYIRNLSDVDALFFDCMGCFSCVQDCTKGLLTMSVNPMYERFGNRYWTPEIVHTTWLQAETAKIPVSGAGYGGPFSGPGFDSMWTDMSEIVRPTRDGIHGREYISTSVDIGGKLPFLSFDSMKRLNDTLPPRVTLPMPLIIDMSPSGFQLPVLEPVKIEAAYRTGLITLIDTADLNRVRLDNELYLPHVAFHLGEKSPDPPDNLVGKTRFLELDDSGAVIERVEHFRSRYPGLVVAVRIDLQPGAVERVVELIDNGADVLHVCADLNGDEIATDRPRFIKDLIRLIHGEIVKKGIRDEVTLIAGGGIALPEHLAKAVICGADLVSVDLPLMIALECHLCGTCTAGRRCPAHLESFDFEYGAERMTNLIAAWHGQLIEVMGAMGMREVRRLRGETGRALFFEELEKETFGPLFGKRVQAGD